MEHGDQAIRSFSSNGLSWTFDANAPQVNEIQPGKIVFATGRAVGRVLALERHGDQVSAILGPVQLTDLVKRGKFAYDQPLDLSQAIAYAAPDYPGAVNSAMIEPPAHGAQGAQSSLRGNSGVWHVAQYYVVSDTGNWTPMRTQARSVPPRFSRPRLLRNNFHPATRSTRMWAMQGRWPFRSHSSHVSSSVACVSRKLGQFHSGADSVSLSESSHDSLQCHAGNRMLGLRRPGPPAVPTSTIHRSTERLQRQDVSFA
jgi:hypothetical protein